MDKKTTKEELIKKLTPLQYNVTQEKGTEPAFHNEYMESNKIVDIRTVDIGRLLLAHVG